VEGIGRSVTKEKADLGLGRPPQTASARRRTKPNNSKGKGAGKDPNVKGKSAGKESSTKGNNGKNSSSPFESTQELVLALKKAFPESSSIPSALREAMEKVESSGTRQTTKDGYTMPDPS